MGMNNLFSKIWQGAVVASMLAAPAALAQVTIYMCGDSTMQDWAAGYCPKQGQGQDFHYWFNSGLAMVVNYGKGGMSLGGGGLDKQGNTAVGYYDMFFRAGCSAGNCIAENLKEGDYVVIQFGINDVNYSTEDFFASNMKKMVADVRAKGAYPIIMSPIRRMWFDSPTEVHPSYRGYPALNEKLATELDVPYIDMFKWVANYMVSVGEEYTKQFVFNYATTDEYSSLSKNQEDATHLQMNGANAFGRIITEQMRAHSDANVKKLGNYMAPMYQVDVKVSPEGSAEATSISAYYPEGMTVMLKTIPKAGKKFLGWYDGNGNKVSGNAVSYVKSPYIYTFKMGSSSTQYTAVYEGGTAEKYTGDGKALTAFPTETPTSLDNVTFVPVTSETGSDTSSTVKVDKDIKKFFDAYKPDEGDGFSENNWEHTGEGFYNFDNKENSFGTYKMNFPGAGYVTLGVRYANGGTTTRTLNAYLDHDYYLSAPPTGAWDKWDTAYVVLDAPLGEAELKFVTVGGDGPNIDAFGFSIDGVCRVSEGNCPAPVPDVDSVDTSKTDVADTSKVDVSDSSKVDVADSSKVDSAATDSAGNVGLVSLKMPTLGNADVRIYDMQGKLVVKREMLVRDMISSAEFNIMVKKTGLYHVVVSKGGSVRHQSMVKIK